MTDDTIEDLEHAEHAHHAAHESDGFTSRVSVTIAVLAVMAATIGSLETLESSGAITAKNEAVLMQSRASDQWTFFQAKSLKKNLYEIAMANGPDDKREEFAKQAKRYEDEGKEISKEATRLETESHEALELGDRHEHRHHIITVGATLLHIAIAITTIAMIIRERRWPYYLGLALAAGGLIASTVAYF